MPSSDQTAVSIFQHLDPRSLLRIPLIYDLHSRFAAPGPRQRRLVTDIVKPQPGSRVLDIGCGTASLLQFMPDVTYVGFDLSAEYVDAARDRYKDNATFHHRALTREVVAEYPPFDLVMAIGVLHHLDDTEAETLFTVALAALGAGGRLVTMDGAFVDGQNPIARMLLKMDRGRFVREPAAYEALARRVFPDVEVSVHHDLIGFPYTHCVMSCHRAS